MSAPARDDLYRDAIMARARAGQGDSRLEPHDGRATADNPLCGDRVTFDLRLGDGRITALGHRTRGCALCQASAESLREAGIGAAAADVERGATALRDYLAGGAEPPFPWRGFALFAPVRGYPSRHGCVLLPFEALRQALAAAAPR